MWPVEDHAASRGFHQGACRIGVKFQTVGPRPAQPVPDGRLLGQVFSEGGATRTVALDNNPEVAAMGQPACSGYRGHAECAGAAGPGETAERHQPSHTLLRLICPPFMSAHHEEPGQARLGQGQPQIQVG
jgi:hypothetical protein